MRGNAVNIMPGVVRIATQGDEGGEATLGRDGENKNVTGED